MAWLQLSVEVSSKLTEVVSDLFNEAGALSVTLLDAEDETLLEPAPGEHPLWSQSRVVGLFLQDFQAAGLQAQLSATFPDFKLTLSSETLEDRDWSSTWRDSFHCMQFGQRLWVCPSGEAAPDPSAITLQLDPGLAFGTGTHVTTALCLEWLDGHTLSGKSVIDFGCGSGILAIAAAALGAKDVRAVDIDPQALQATRENSRRNRVGQRVNVSLPAMMPLQPAQVLIANILANPLIEMANTLQSLVVHEGSIVLTGILEMQAQDVMMAYRRWFVFEEPVSREGWVRLSARRMHPDAGSNNGM